MDHFSGLRGIASRSCYHRGPKWAANIFIMFGCSRK